MLAACFATSKLRRPDIQWITTYHFDDNKLNRLFNDKEVMEEKIQTSGKKKKKDYKQ